MIFVSHISELLSGWGSPPASAFRPAPFMRVANRQSNFRVQSIIRPGCLFAAFSKG
jgi:hypothetical protein